MKRVGIDRFPTIVVVAWGFIPELVEFVSIPQLWSHQKQKVALTVFDGWWLLKTKNSPTLFMVRAPNRWNVMPCDFKNSNRGAWVWGHSRFIPKLLVARLGFGGRCKEHFPKRQRNAITEKNPHETQIDRFWLITQIPRGASENFLKSRYEILPNTVLRLHVKPPYILRASFVIMSAPTRWKLTVVLVPESLEREQRLREQKKTCWRFK